MAAKGWISLKMLNMGLWAIIESQQTCSELTFITVAVAHQGRHPTGRVWIPNSLIKPLIQLFICAIYSVINVIAVAITVVLVSIRPHVLPPSLWRVTLFKIKQKQQNNEMQLPTLGLQSVSLVSV